MMYENPGYGLPRIAMAFGINKKRAARVKKKFGLRPARRAQTPRKPDDIGRETEAVSHVLATLSPIAPDTVWASDFTFIEYGRKFIYLSSVIDVFTGEVLGFNIRRSDDARFVRLAIERAIQRTSVPPVWCHFDPGSEHASALVLNWLQVLGVTISMNPKGCP